MVNVLARKTYSTSHSLIFRSKSIKFSHCFGVKLHQWRQNFVAYDCDEMRFKRPSVQGQVMASLDVENGNVNGNGNVVVLQYLWNICGISIWNIYGISVEYLYGMSMQYL